MVPGKNQRSSTGSNLPSDHLRDLIRRGEYLHAYDAAVSLIELGDTSPETRFLGVLSLARSGATTRARHRHSEWGLTDLDRRSLPPTLAQDLEVLAARLDKDEALWLDGEDRATWARKAAFGYQAAFDTSRLAYHAINAATMWLLAGDAESAREAASRAMSEGRLQGNAYWDAATEAEAALLLGDLSRARDALEVADETGPTMFSERATTLRQLGLVCRLAGVDPAILDPLRNPTVAHYCGHRILAEGATGRFPANDESAVRAQLDEAFSASNVGFGYGSLAAGADILAAEALLARKAELRVILPFEAEEFIRTSVLPAGEQWVRRFKDCLALADHVEAATTGDHLDDPVLFDFCGRLAMGQAIMRGDFLAAEAHQVAVWDGSVGRSDGTAINVANWAETGWPATIIAIDSGPWLGPTPTRGSRRQIRGIVTADFAGFSTLDDRQVLIFQGQVMGTLAHALVPFQEKILSGRSWGDGLNFVTSDVASAAECALALRKAATEIDYPAIGLPTIRGLRIAAHAAPVFEGPDPIAGGRMFFGAGFTSAARIEPQTPEGEIYTTKPFAALAMLIPGRRYEIQYVGTLPTGKGHGPVPLFALRARVDP